MSGVSHNLTSVQWRHPEYLAHVGALSIHNVMDYFSESPFWDRQSTNQVLRMQTQYAVADGSLNEAEELKRFVGVEFAIVHAIPPSLFIIQKRQRMGPNDTRPIAAYYVMNENVYQAPDLYQVLSARVLASVHAFRSSFDLVKAKAPPFDPRRGHQFHILEPSAEQQLPSTTAPTDSQVDASQMTTAADALSVEKKPPTSTDRQKTQNSLAMARALQTTMASFFPA